MPHPTPAVRARLKCPHLLSGDCVAKVFLVDDRKFLGPLMRICVAT
jgi:hypothetical protein